MAEDAVNDDSRLDDTQNYSPDPYGRAAILVVESLIHGLVARSIIRVAEAVEILDIAAEVEGDVSAEQGVPSATTRKAVALIDAMSSSLRMELPSDAT